VSHPFASLFGGGSTSSAQTNPFLMMTTQAAAPPPPPSPASQPVGSPSTYKPAQGSSFLSSAAPAAATGQTANKTLLGQ